MHTFEKNVPTHPDIVASSYLNNNMMDRNEATIVHTILRKCLIKTHVPAKLTKKQNLLAETKLSNPIRRGNWRTTAHQRAKTSWNVTTKFTYGSPVSIKLAWLRI
jgi:hypothetical protein